MEEIASTLLELIMVVIATEAATNLITKSEFSIRFIKKPLFKYRRFKLCSVLHDILDCGYCTSVWMAVIFAILYFSESLHFLVAVLIIHRLSNVLHFIIDWFDMKRPRDL